MTERQTEAPAHSSGRFEENFQEVFDEYYGSVFRFFANRGFSSEDCRDLAQETFVALYRSASRFEGRASLKTWILSIAANVWRSNLRHLHRDKRRAEIVPLEGLTAAPAEEPAPSLSGGLGENPLRQLLTQERIRFLNDAIEALPEGMRQCLELYYGQELKYREIAVVLQVSINTVKTQLLAARRKLKSSLGEVLPGPADKPAGGIEK